MNPFLNLIWLLCGGIFTAIEYLIASLLMMVTIIGIPFGFQTLKLAGLALWPFGKEVRSPRFGRLPQYHNEYSLAVSRWNLDQPLSPGMGNSALYHNYWYTIRETTLQTCRTGSDSLRKGYCR